jgi:SEC-C motif domain protein
MRSRYTAYVVGEIDYLIATHDASTRARIDLAATTAWSRDTQWQGLEIIDTVAGAATDQEGVVEFIARGITRGVPFAHRERSRFRREAERWYYLTPGGDGVVPRPSPHKAAAAQRPNEPCACGSGRKFKRCHGTV